TGPVGVVGRREEVSCFLFGFRDGATQVAVPDVKLHGDHPLALLAINRRGAGSLKGTLGVGCPVTPDRAHQVSEAETRRIRYWIGRIDETSHRRWRRNAGTRGRRRITGTRGRDDLVVRNINLHIENRSLARSVLFWPTKRD